MKFLGGAKHVKRYVSMAPLWHGTQIAAPFAAIAGVFGVRVDQAVPLCVACGQFAPGLGVHAPASARGGVAVRRASATPTS